MNILRVPENNVYLLHCWASAVDMSAICLMYVLSFLSFIVIALCWLLHLLATTKKYWIITLRLQIFRSFPGILFSLYIWNHYQVIETLESWYLPSDPLSLNSGHGSYWYLLSDINVAHKLFLKLEFLP